MNNVRAPIIASSIDAIDTCNGKDRLVGELRTRLSCRQNEVRNKTDGNALLLTDETLAPPCVTCGSSRARCDAGKRDSTADGVVRWEDRLRLCLCLQAPT